jgi:hypothetical protein
MPILSISRLQAAIAASTLALATPCVHADCIADAAARHQVNAEVLRAIGWQESRLQPAALGRNANGSIDVGAFQINSVHLTELGRYGIGASALTDGCVSAEVAAWHYRHQVDRDGDSWLAVGDYHSRNPARAAWYANRIASILMRWHVMPEAGLPFPAERTLGPGRSPAPSLSARAIATPTHPTPPAPSANDAIVAWREVDYCPSPR